MRTSEENMRSRSVIGADGLLVGQLSTVFLDTETWRVEAVQVSLRKEIADQLGAHRSMFQAGSIEIPVSMVQSVGDTVVLTVPVEELRQLLPGDAAATVAGGAA